MAKIHVLGMYNKVPVGGISVDTTSRSGQWKGLSPFNLTGIPLYQGAWNPPEANVALNFENAWQFAKVYAKHADAQGNPTPDYWQWARLGWADPKPHRYPAGKGAVPLYSLWAGKQLGYIDARKTIYGPLYAAAVQQTDSFQLLQTLVAGPGDIYLRDYDGYDHETLNMSLTDVLHNPRKKMGHVFVLKALLTNDPMLQQLTP